MWIQIGVIFIFILLLIYKGTKKPNRFPPGPPRLPIIGSLPYINIRSNPSEPPSLMTGILQGRNNVIQTNRLPKKAAHTLYYRVTTYYKILYLTTNLLLIAVSKYGNVVGFYVGNEPQVAIADFSLIKDLMKRDDTASRPKMAPFQDIRPGGTIKGILDKENSEWLPGVVFSRDKTWADQRRFTLRVLRDFGFGKSSMEDTLLDEVEKLCDELNKSVGKAIDIRIKMNISILNALWSMLTSEKLPLNDPKLQNIVDRFNTFFSKSTNPTSALASMWPAPQMIRWSIFKPLLNVMGFDLDSVFTSMKGITELAEKQIKRHKDNLDEDNICDFIDAYLVEMKKNENNKQSSFYKDRGHYYLVNVLIDLFVAGMETTSSAITWSCLLLLHHPEIKRNVQKEIDAV